MKYFWGVIHRLFSPFTTISTRTMPNYRKVFVIHVDAENKLKIKFASAFPELPERDFTFMRPKEEKLQTTISRMKLKVAETIAKKFELKKKKKKVAISNEDVSPVSVTISLSKGGEEVDVEMKNIDAWTVDTQMKINEFVYDVVENPPLVLHLSLPKSIMSGFPVYPRIELESCTKEQCYFNWYRTVSKSDRKDVAFDTSKVMKFKNEYWLPLSTNFCYFTKESDIGCKLKLICKPKCENKVGIMAEAVSVNAVEFCPNKCPFENRHKFTEELTPPGSFRCVSYNILADIYADSETARNDLFPYCPAEALMLDYRKQLYLKEIIGYNADVICLQEVDRKVFRGDLIPVLSSSGLEGIFNEKGNTSEGVACFYRSSKFKVVETHAILLSDALKNDPVLQSMLLKISENDNLKERIMHRTTVLQVVLLESLDVPQKRVLIGNTHLYFHPISDNIRLIQAASSIIYLESLLLKYQKENPQYTTSLILSGDFNSCPDFGVYQLMTKGYLSEDCTDWKSNKEEAIPGVALKHSLSLDSACGTPKYTNYTELFDGCLDYIFYDKSHLEVSAVVPFPTHAEVTKHKALPNKIFPSDHIALVCTLKWK